MNELAPFSTTFDRFAAAAFGALVGMVVIGVVTGWILLLPLVLAVGSVLALPSMVLLTALVELVTRRSPALHASFPVWLFSGLLATGPLFAWASYVDPDGRDRLPLAVGIGGLMASIAAWGFYVRREERIR